MLFIDSTLQNVISLYALSSFIALLPMMIVWVVFLKREPIINDIFSKEGIAPWQEWARIYLIVVSPIWLLVFFFTDPIVIPMFTNEIANIVGVNQIYQARLLIFLWFVLAIPWWVSWGLKRKS